MDKLIDVRLTDGRIGRSLELNYIYGRTCGRTFRQTELRVDVYKIYKDRKTDGIDGRRVDDRDGWLSSQLSRRTVDMDGRLDC